MEVIQISIIHFDHKKSYQSYIKYQPTRVDLSEFNIEPNERVLK